MRTERFLLAVLASVSWACHATEAPEGHSGGGRAKLDARTESEIAARIERGRALLDHGQPAEAEALFAWAAAADHESLRTRMWVLRSWMDQGKSNETLDALDEFDRAGEKGLEMAYLYGMAFARRAEDQLASGVTDSSVHMNFQTATDLLTKAVKADATRFRDAFLPLATSARYVEQIETARWAADHAVEAQADSAESWLMRGRILMIQFTAAEGEEAGGTEAESLWQQAVESFTNSVQRLGPPPGENARARLAMAATQLGHALLWRRRGPEATASYGTAIAAAPEAFEYGRVVEFLRGVPVDPTDDRPCGFRAALELGQVGLAERQEASATLLWWLGWARFVDADWSGSESAFQASLALAPEYTSAWFYIGLTRQYRKDSPGALEAMHAGWNADPAAMISTAGGAGGALRAFEALLGWCAAQEPPRNLDAAFLAEMLSQAMPGEARHWNNVGLFLRDEGERLEIEAYKNKTPEPDPALLADYYGRALEAYRRALELTPDDPQLINDTALMLHYHFVSEVGEVEAMYRRALERVDAALSSSDLSEADRTRFEQTKEDIGINLERLLNPEAEPEAESEDGAAVGTDAPSTAEAAASEDDN